MTDDLTNPVPDDAGDDAPLGGVSEAELDRMLTQAGELVDQLSSELGEADAEPVSTAGEAQTHDDSVAPALEEELTRLKSLTDATSAEVIGADDPADLADPDAELADLFPSGFPPPVPPEVLNQALAGPAPAVPASTDRAAAQWPIEEKPKVPIETRDADAPAETVTEPELPETRPIEEADTVPDFMKEFMEPEPEPEPKPEPNSPDSDDATAASPEVPELITHATAMPVQTKPGVVGTGTLHQVVKRAPKQEDDADEVATEKAAAKPRNPVLRIVRGLVIAILQRLRNIGPVKPVLTRLGYWICDKSVLALEKIDTPITSVGERIRRVVGWVAMATLGTSGIVYVISFF